MATWKDIKLPFFNNNEDLTFPDDYTFDTGIDFNLICSPSPPRNVIEAQQDFTFNEVTSNINLQSKDILSQISENDCTFLSNLNKNSNVVNKG